MWCTGGRKQQENVKVYNWRVVVGSLILMAVAPGVWSQGADGLPQIKGRIADQAQIISSSQEHQLYQILAQQEHATHQRVAVVTTETAGAESTQEFSGRIWQAWAREDKSRCVLLVLFKQPGSAAIIAGDTLSKMFDAPAIQKIIDEDMAAGLKGGDFDGAAMEGVKGIVAVLNQ
jgi:uncharacterized protein